MISPVISRSPRTGIFVSALQIVVAIVIPANGPSLGIAPSFGDMQVNDEIAVEIPRQSERQRTRPDIAEGRLRGLLHHVSQFAGDSQLAFAFHQDAFRGQNLPAHFGPGKARSRPDFAHPVGCGIPEPGGAEKFGDLIGIHDNLLLVASAYTILRTTFRATLPISRSRLRTPDSRV